MRIKSPHLILLFSLFSMSSYADFEVMKGSEPVSNIKNVRGESAEGMTAKTLPLSENLAKNADAPHMKSVSAGLSHIGRKPVVIPEVIGFGNKVTLKEALYQIVPKEFQVYNDSNIPLDQIVSWNSVQSSDWADALDGVLKSAGVYATLDWSTKSLNLMGVAPMNKAAITPVIMPEQKWRILSTDKTIRASLIRWSKDAKYNLDWDVPVDFPVSIQTTFTGDFESAITQLMDSLKGSDYPLQACSYENRTIRIVKAGEASRCLIGH